MLTFTNAELIIKGNSVNTVTPNNFQLPWEGEEEARKAGREGEKQERRAVNVESQISISFI